MKEADLAAWPHGSASAIGQTGEFLVWANLIAHSGGGLHVFLPMLDRGLDAVVHRLADGAYLAVQVKTKTALLPSETPIAVDENRLFTDDQLVVGVYLEDDRLGPYALVADASTFRKKAGRVVDRGRTILVADMPLHPIPGHKWSEDLVPVEQLANRWAVQPLPVQLRPRLSRRPRKTGSSASGAKPKSAAVWPHWKTAACSAPSRTTRSRRCCFDAWPPARRLACR